jgi:3-oxoacyl-(acyl-carrier-protein) synthase
VSQLALVAAKLAVDDSALQVTKGNAGRVGVCFGTSAGKLEVDVVGESSSVHCGAQICIMCGQKLR